MITKRSLAKKILQSASPIATAPVPAVKARKIGSAGSQSRDIREDRGTRQMKSSGNPQTMPHGR